MLRYGFLASLAEPHFLIWGISSDVKNFANLIRDSHTFPAKKSLVDLGCHAQTGETVLLVSINNEGRGMIPSDGPDNIFLWEIDQRHAADFADLLDTLADCNEGHQYLETGSDRELVVMVSVGEYPDDFLIE